MNAYQACQKESSGDAGLGCLAPFFSFFILGTMEEIFFPNMNFLLFLVLWGITSALFSVIALFAAQKLWDDQWKDPCLTRGGMKI